QLVFRNVISSGRRAGLANLRISAQSVDILVSCAFHCSAFTKAECMYSPKLLDQIPVPVPRPAEIYRVRLFDHDYSFVGLKALLGAADFSKAGDRGAGLAAPTEVVREA